MKMLIVRTLVACIVADSGDCGWTNIVFLKIRGHQN